MSAQISQTPSVPGATALDPVDATSVTSEPASDYSTMQQNAAECSTLGIPLKPKQQLAIPLLVQGKSDTEVAQIVGVNRSTLARWKLHHPTFQARLNAARLTLWQSAVDSLRAILQPALAILTDRLMDPADRSAQFRAAVQTLKISGISKAVHRAGPIYLRDVLSNRIYEEQHRFYTVDPEFRMYPPSDDRLEEMNSTLLSFINREETRDVDEQPES